MFQGPSWQGNQSPAGDVHVQPHTARHSSLSSRSLHARPIRKPRPGRFGLQDSRLSSHVSEADRCVHTRHCFTQTKTSTTNDNWNDTQVDIWNDTQINNWDNTSQSFKTSSETITNSNFNMNNITTSQDSFDSDSDVESIFLYDNNKANKGFQRNQQSHFQRPPTFNEMGSNQRLDSDIGDSRQELTSEIDYPSESGWVTVSSSTLDSRCADSLTPHDCMSNTDKNTKETLINVINLKPTRNGAKIFKDSPEVSDVDIESDICNLEKPLAPHYKQLFSKKDVYKVKQVKQDNSTSEEQTLINQISPKKYQKPSKIGGTLNLDSLKTTISTVRFKDELKADNRSSKHTAARPSARGKNKRVEKSNTLLSTCLAQSCADTPGSLTPTSVSSFDSLASGSCSELDQVGSFQPPLGKPKIAW